jgi:putative ATPase
MEAPLAERIRPKKLEDYKPIPSCGTKWSLTQQIAKELSFTNTMGTAGNGKTLAQIIAQESKRPILSAINSGVKGIRM